MTAEEKFAWTGPCATRVQADFTARSSVGVPPLAKSYFNDRRKANSNKDSRHPWPSKGQ